MPAMKYALVKPALVLPFALMVGIIGGWTHDAIALPADKKEQCAEVKAQIRWVESQMRAGYTARQGRRLEDRLRYLKEKRSRVC